MIPPAIRSSHHKYMDAKYGKASKMPRRKVIENPLTVQEQELIVVAKSWADLFAKMPQAAAANIDRDDPLYLQTLAAELNMLLAAKLAEKVPSSGAGKS